jgi:pSer/pThr/pTyr-binding forkhead associated (FHA) protein
MPAAPTEPSPTKRAPAQTILAGSGFDAATTHRLEPREAAGGESRPGVDREAGTSPGWKGPPASAKNGKPAHGHLVVVTDSDGSPREVHPLAGEVFELGRTEGDLVFDDDPHLAPRHARLTFVEGRAWLRALDGTNGVFVRVREPHELQTGDQILVGDELLRYEAVTPEEQVQPAVYEHGVRLLGSRPQDDWGRLRELTPSGTARDVWHLSGDEVSIGPRGSDVPLAGAKVQVARVRHQAGGAFLEDAGSAAGAFVRIRGERELRDGDVVRIGVVVLRFES